LRLRTDEVKATHSASVSQIDPEQVYYLMTRGIPQEEARKMLALGFFSSPSSRWLTLTKFRWGIRSLLEGKWGGPVTELFEEPEVTITSLFRKHTTSTGMEDRVREMLKLLSTDEDVPSLKELRGSSRPVSSKEVRGPELLLIKTRKLTQRPMVRSDIFPWRQMAFYRQKPDGDCVEGIRGGDRYFA
jgi:hypothetical protein